MKTGTLPIQAQADVVIENHGSLFLITPMTPAATEWCQQNLPEDAPMWGVSYAVEHRYARDIADGMVNDGLIVQ